MKIIDLTAFAEAFSAHVVHMCMGLEAAADNAFEAENKYLSEAFQHGDLDADTSAYDKALHLRDERYDLFRRSLRFYRQTVNCTLDDDELDYMFHQRIQQWIIDMATQLNAPITIAYDATAETWVERKIA